MIKTDLNFFIQIFALIKEFGTELANDTHEDREAKLEILKILDASAATRRAVHVTDNVHLHSNISHHPTSSSSSSLEDPS